MEGTAMTDYEHLKVAEFDHWSLYVHGSQYYLGRVYLWAKRTDVVDLMDALPEEREEFFSVGTRVRDALQELFQPDLFNYAALANVSAHMHVHVIPRYKTLRTFEGITFTDHNWGKNYAPYDTKFKIPEEKLILLAARIRDTLQA